MREKLLAIGDDFWIENDRGERAYEVNGKAFRLPQTFVLEDASGVGFKSSRPDLIPSESRDENGL